MAINPITGVQQQPRRIQRGTLAATTPVPQRTGDAGDEFRRALFRGVQEVGSLGQETLAAGQAALGFEEAARRNLEEAQRDRELVQRVASPRIGRIEDIGSSGDFVQDVTDFLAQLAGSQLPIIGTLAATGAAGGIVGRIAARGAGGVGTVAGVGGGSAALETGSIFGEIARDPEAEGTLQEQALLSGVGGVVAGSLDALPIFQATRRLGVANPVERSLIARAARAAVPQAGSEALTEAAQTLVERGTHAFANRNFEILGPEGASELLNAAAAGGILGGGLGAITGALQRPGPTDEDLVGEVEAEEATNRLLLERRVGQMRGFVSDEVLDQFLAQPVVDDQLLDDLDALAPDEVLEARSLERERFLADLGSRQPFQAVALINDSLEEGKATPQEVQLGLEFALRNLDRPIQLRRTRSTPGQLARKKEGLADVREETIQPADRRAAALSLDLLRNALRSEEHRAVAEVVLRERNPQLAEELLEDLDPEELGTQRQTASGFDDTFRNIRDFEQELGGGIFTEEGFVPERTTGGVNEVDRGFQDQILSQTTGTFFMSPKAIARNRALRGESTEGVEAIGAIDEQIASLQQLDATSTFEPVPARLVLQTEADRRFGSDQSIRQDQVAFRLEKAPIERAAREGSNEAARQLEFLERLERDPDFRQRTRAQAQQIGGERGERILQFVELADRAFGKRDFLLRQAERHARIRRVPLDPDNPLGVFDDEFAIQRLRTRREATGEDTFVLSEEALGVGVSQKLRQEFAARRKAIESNDRLTDLEKEARIGRLEKEQNSRRNRERFIRPAPVGTLPNERQLPISINGRERFLNVPQLVKQMVRRIRIDQDPSLEFRQGVKFEDLSPSLSDIQQALVMALAALQSVPRELPPFDPVRFAKLEARNEKEAAELEQLELARVKADQATEELNTNPDLESSERAALKRQQMEPKDQRRLDTLRDHREEYERMLMARTRDELLRIQEQRREELTRRANSPEAQRAAQNQEVLTPEEQDTLAAIEFVDVGIPDLSTVNQDLVILTDAEGGPLVTLGDVLPQNRAQQFTDFLNAIRRRTRENLKARKGTGTDEVRFLQKALDEGLPLGPTRQFDARIAEIQKVPAKERTEEQKKELDRLKRERSKQFRALTEDERDFFRRRLEAAKGIGGITPEEVALSIVRQMSDREAAGPESAPQSTVVGAIRATELTQEQEGGISQVRSAQVSPAQEFERARREKIGQLTGPIAQLPNYRSGQKTLRYAGIGSRKTPPEIQKRMRRIAEFLAERGYTLFSGGAVGADQAFEAGAGQAKQIFKAQDATPFTREVAKQVHPTPSRLSSRALDLMARNTFQVFGADLSSPVDFVLAWTPDGAETTAQRSFSTGGTGQAIDLANRKGVPVINLANEGWEQRLLDAVKPEGLPSTQLGRRILEDITGDEFSFRPGFERLGQLSDSDLRAIEDFTGRAISRGSDSLFDVSSERPASPDDVFEGDFSGDRRFDAPRASEPRARAVEREELRRLADASLDPAARQAVEAELDARRGQRREQPPRQPTPRLRTIEEVSPTQRDPVAETQAQADRVFERIEQAELTELNQSFARVKGRAKRWNKRVQIKGLRILNTSNAIRILQQRGDSARLQAIADGTLLGFTVGESVWVSPFIDLDTQFEVLAHEMGHALAHSTAPANDQQMFDAWSRWREQAGKGTPAEARRTMRFAFDQLGTTVPESMANLSQQDLEYVFDFHEWFADEIAEWLVKDAQPQGSVERWFNRFANKFSTLFGETREQISEDSVGAFLERTVFNDGYMASRVRWHGIQDARAPAAGVVEDPTTQYAHHAVLAMLRSGWLTGAPAAVLARVFAVNSSVNRRVQNILRRFNRQAAVQVSKNWQVAAAYGFQLWADGALDLGPQGQSAYERLKDNIFKSLGDVPDIEQMQELAPQIQADIERFQRQNPSPAVIEDVISRARTDGQTSSFVLTQVLANTRLQRLGKASRDLWNQYLSPFTERIFLPAVERMERTGNAALIEIARRFHTPPGTQGRGESYLQARSAMTGVWQDRAARALGDLTAEKAERVRRAMLFGGPMDAETQTIVHKLRAEFDDMFTYARRAGVENLNRGSKQFLKRKNYFPWVYDTDQLQARKDEFVEFLLRPEYSVDMQRWLERLQSEGPIPTDPNAEFISWAQIYGITDHKTLAEHIHGQISNYQGYADTGRINTNKTGTTPYMSAVNTRGLNFLQAKATGDGLEVLDSFFSKDLNQILRVYTEQLVKRAEFTRRFRIHGDGSTELDDLLHQAAQLGASKRELQLARDFVDAMQGTLGTRTNALVTELLTGEAPPSSQVINPKLQDTFSAAVLWQNVRVLGLATFASLADPVGIAVRGGDLTSLWAGFKAAFTSKTFISDAEGQGYTAKEVAQALGIISTYTIDQALASTYGTNFMTGRTRLWNERFFRVIGLSKLNEVSRVAATGAGLQFLQKHAHRPTQHSQRYLDELNLTPEDVVLGVDGQVKLLTRAEQDAAFKSDFDEYQRDLRIRAALRRFVDESILRPNAATRPIWGSDPHFQLIIQLKSFMFTFHSQILRRVFNEVTEGRFLAAPALLMIFVPAMIAADVARDWFRFGGEGDPLKQNWGLLEWTFHGMERSGLPGLGLLLLDAKQDRQWGGLGLETFLGPTATSIGDVGTMLIGDDEQRWQAAIDQLPLQNVAPVRNVYDTTLPVTGGLLSAFAPAPAPASDQAAQ